MVAAREQGSRDAPDGEGGEAVGYGQDRRRPGAGARVSG
jgi:hypothetical protein